MTGTCKFKLKVAGLQMATSPAAPVRAHLRYGGEDIDRAGEIAGCTATATTLRCKSS